MKVTRLVFKKIAYKKATLTTDIYIIFIELCI